jgi:hypothetical protein
MLQFFQFIIYGPTMGRAETQPTDWVWPPTPLHCLANNNRQGRVYFCGKFSCRFDFLKNVALLCQKRFKLYSYFPTLGTAKTHPTDWVWPPAPHLHLTNNNRQGRVYVCGEFSCPNVIYWCYITISQMKIQFISYGLNMGTVKSHPTDWVWPTAFTTALTKLIGRGGNIFAVRF